MVERREVLDHGFVELIDIMGDDAEPARAARISYGNINERNWDQDAKLIKYLWDNQHTTPFEMIELKWRMKMPIFVARQIVRHRTANINEFSMRYADPTRLSEQDKIEYYTPEIFLGQDGVNKQSSSQPLDDQIEALIQYTRGCDTAISAYKDLITLGVSREIARGTLPVATYTEWIWKNDCWNTLHFLKLRTDEHAQYETRMYANAMLSIMQERLPNLMSVVWPKND